jgi:hypothetical protein
MPNTSSAKGNPASHRMSNPALKARRAGSWMRGQARKAARVAKEKAAHKRNVETGISPWQQAKAARAQRRRARGK